MALCQSCSLKCLWFILVSLLITVYLFVNICAILLDEFVDAAEQKAYFFTDLYLKFFLNSSIINREILLEKHITTDIIVGLFPYLYCI